MIWRQPYETQVREHFAAPDWKLHDLDGCEVTADVRVLVAGPVEAWGEIELWRRLLEEHQPLIVITGIQRTESAWVRQLVPVSLQPRVALTSQTIEEAGGRAVAAVIQDVEWPIMMIGPPTEDALERLLAAV